MFHPVSFEDTIDEGGTGSGRKKTGSIKSFNKIPKTKKIKTVKLASRVLKVRGAHTKKVAKYIV